MVGVPLVLFPRPSKNPLSLPISGQFCARLGNWQGWTKICGTVGAGSELLPLFSHKRGLSPPILWLISFLDPQLSLTPVSPDPRQTMINKQSRPMIFAVWLPKNCNMQWSMTACVSLKNRTG
jgi:hypothetical protein